MKADRSWYLIGGLLVIGVIGALCGVFIVKRSPTDVTKLRQVHVIFSHGERTPTEDEIELFPLNTNKDEKIYYPHGYGALTNKGKMTMFNTGATIRSLYDELLTKEYSQYSFKMQSADTDISKMSALLVLAGLWPVESDLMWNNLLWQPIPYFNLEKEHDYMLFVETCPKYTMEKQKVEKEISENLNTLYEDTFKYLRNYTGSNITDTFHVKKLWNLVLAQENLSLPRPEWFTSIEREIRSLIKLEYNNMFYNFEMRRLGAGALFQKIVNDTKEKIEHDNEGTESMKMYMFSGYSHNIAAVLAATDNLHLFEEEFGASIIMELHLRMGYADYAYTMFYKKIDGEKINIEIPNCGKMCPLEDFEKIMSLYLIKDYENECKVN